MVFRSCTEPLFSSNGTGSSRMTTVFFDRENMTTSVLRVVAAISTGNCNCSGGQKGIDHLHNYGLGFGASPARIGCDVCVSHLSFRFPSTLECRSAISVLFLAVPIEAWLVLHSYLIVFNGQVSSGSVFLLAIRQAD